MQVLDTEAGWEWREHIVTSHVPSFLNVRSITNLGMRTGGLNRISQMLQFLKCHRVVHPVRVAPLLAGGCHLHTFKKTLFTISKYIIISCRVQHTKHIEWNPSENTCHSVTRHFKSFMELKVSFVSARACRPSLLCTSTHHHILFL
jgi:hypothetical protein